MELPDLVDVDEEERQGPCFSHAHRPARALTHVLADAEVSAGSSSRSCWDGRALFSSQHSDGPPALVETSDGESDSDSEYFTYHPGVYDKMTDAELRVQVLGRANAVTRSHPHLSSVVWWSAGWIRRSTCGCVACARFSVAWYC